MIHSAVSENMSLDQQGKSKRCSLLGGQSKRHVHTNCNVAVKGGCSQTLLRLPESDSANKLPNDVMNRERGTRISFRLLVKHEADFCWKLT